LNVPIQKNVVLLGAGNAHLRFVKMFGMRPVPEVAVTLVSEAAVIPYSAMVPGHIGGEYSQNEITIDLVRLCRAVNVRFVSARAVRVDAGRRLIHFDSRPEMGYDVLSLGLGSRPAHPPSFVDSPTSWPMRPLSSLLDRLKTLDDELRQQPRSFHLVIVGGGASGCELTLAIQKRLPVRLTLLQSNTRLLPGFPDKAGRIMADLMRERGITVRLNALVTGGDDKTLHINTTERLACDAVLWATNAAPPELLAASGFQLDANGFLLVNDQLQALTDAALFGTGDCISINSHPHLLKNGVYAVRQGGVLFDNVFRFLKESPLLRFRPQRWCACVMNCSDDTAVFTYGPVVWRGRLARRLKHRIDRNWMDQFTVDLSRIASSMPRESKNLVEMRCGGCGSKISSDVLTTVLAKIDVGDDPRILLGCGAGEDASVHRVRPEQFGPDPTRLVEVQTVDYFKAFVDDPYLFGRVAALNALSDLYAMNARPFTALAIATLPHARGPVQERMLHELLTGAVTSLRHHGVILTGGHTSEGQELALGFAVTGFAEEDRLFRKSRLRLGDALILTKPLGSGALLAAWMRGECRADWFTALVDNMLISNQRAAEIFAGHGVEACTDVTGFGLAGHLLEMLDASGVSAELIANAIPLHVGFNDVVAKGIVSTLHGDNARSACRVATPGEPPAWLFDPQTSGGLLAAVTPTLVPTILRELKQSGYDSAALIGTIREAGVEVDKLGTIITIQPV
jgi:selenide,water dikinase